MNRKIAWITVVVVLLGLLAQPISLADPIDYEDFVAQIVKTWNPELTRDGLIELYGKPYSETDTYMTIWQEGDMYTQYWYFVDGRLSSVLISCGPYGVEHRSWMYDRYTNTKDKLIEELGKTFGYLPFFEGSDQTWEDLNCAARAWSHDGIGVLLVYNQAGDELRISVEIAQIP